MAIKIQDYATTAQMKQIGRLLRQSLTKPTRLKNGKNGRKMKNVS
jgi:hypothetical protein